MQKMVHVISAPCFLFSLLSSPFSFSSLSEEQKRRLGQEELLTDGRGSKRYVATLISTGQASDPHFWNVPRKIGIIPTPVGRGLAKSRAQASRGGRGEGQRSQSGNVTSFMTGGCYIVQNVE